MPAKFLTDAAIRAEVAKATGGNKRVELRDTSSRGLVLRITPNGVATFVYAYRPKGERIGRRMKLGTYPDTGLGEARDMANQRRSNLDKGNDPIELEKAAEAAKASAKAAETAKANRLTFRELAQEYITERVPKEFNRQKLRTLFAAELFPSLGLSLIHI